jgi:protein SCO1/2
VSDGHPQDVRGAIRVPVLAALVAAAVLAGLAAGLYLGGGGRPPKVGGIVYPEPRPVPAFELTAGDGSAFSRERLAGHWSFVFFGYTHCPDVCPLTLADLEVMHDELGQATFDHPLQVLFVSVDPDRDTPDRLAEYVGYFDPSFIGATGDAAQLGKLAKAFGVVFKAHSDQGGNYPVDHSTAILLVDPQTRLAAVLTPPHEGARLAADFRNIVDWWSPSG